MEGSSGDLANLQYAGRKGSSRNSRGKCHACCGRIMAAMCSNLGICLLVLLYTVAGGFIFATIEGNGNLHIRLDPIDFPASQEVLKPEASQVSPEQRLNHGEHSGSLSARQLRQDTVERLWTITESLNILYRDNWTRVAEKELLKFTEGLLANIRFEKEAVAPSRTREGVMGNSEYQWTFPGSFLYSLTVITTIGYGSVAPKTALGKATTVIYALLGIPLTLLYLSSVGDLLSRILKWMWHHACRCRRMSKKDGTVPQGNHVPSHYTNIDPTTKSKWSGSEGGLNCDDEWPPDDESATVPAVICLVVMISYICGGGAVFSHAFGWPYLDSLYFCFSSLTTIGFGGMAPPTSPHEPTGVQIALLSCSLYLLIGMALIATCFNLMQEQMTSKGVGFGRRLGGYSPPHHRYHLQDS